MKHEATNMANVPILIVYYIFRNYFQSKIKINEEEE